jgi:hypothetical protein
MLDYFCLPQENALLHGSERDVVRRFMDLRLRYVTAMGWLDGLVSDEDDYDNDSRTWYFIRQSSAPAGDTEPAITAAMRATRVTSFYDTLTWSMLGADAKRQADIIADNLPLLTDVNRAAADPRSGLWDITRLVSPVDGSVSAAEIVRSIYEVLGMVMRKTVLEPDADPVWMFLTTPTIKRLFEISGIPCTVLFAGRVTPGDEDDAFLCVARPKRAWDRIGHSTTPRHRRAFDHVRAGSAALVEQVPAAVVA